MNLLLVLLLAGLWGAVFLPAIVRARHHTSPIASVGSFRRGMRALGAGGIVRSSRGRWVVVPKSPEDLEAPRKRALIRRRKVFIALLGSSLSTFLFGLLPGLHGLLKANIAFDLILAGYVFYLLQAKEHIRQMPIGLVNTEQTEEEEEDAYARAGQF